jgi:hypothetical protein
MCDFAVFYCWLMIGLWLVVSFLSDRESRKAIRNAKRIIN